MRRWVTGLGLLVAAAPAAAAPPPPPEAFRAVVERPLFRPERRPPPVVVDSPPATPTLNAITTPPIAFVGTLTRRGRRVALVTADSPGRLTELGLGDEIDGWRVVRLEVDRLVLERDGRMVEYRLDLRRELR